MSRQRISDPTRFSRRLAAVDMDDVFRGLDLRLDWARSTCSEMADCYD